MSGRSDTGNFVVLILVAGFAGVFLGDWAFKTVIYLGIAGMILGLIVYIARSWGIRLDAPAAQGTRPEPAPRVRVKRLSDEDLPDLLRAVAKRDGATIERLVVRHNLSPYQVIRWNGEDTSAMGLATNQRYEDAVAFFQAWTAQGNTARFPGPTKPQEVRRA